MKQEKTVREAAELDRLIAAYAGGPFNDSTKLAEAGVVSLAVFRIIADLGPSTGVEINAERLADVHTIGDLKAWLWDLT